MFKNDTEKHKALKRLAFVAIVNNFVLFAAVIRHRNAIQNMESAHSVTDVIAKSYKERYNTTWLKLRAQENWLSVTYPDVYLEMNRELMELSE